ncbi:hypothetical protein FB451DRAFT_290065 [Mycena latifolia]|nr:hypothetical protein FB451DRAFT_290065 [Mycena latifolia]
MRNEHFQDSLFRSLRLGRSWPKRDSGYPVDLIQLWEDHGFISSLCFNLKQTTNKTSPTCKFDATYRKILCRHPDLVFFLKSKIVKPDRMANIVEFEFLGPQCNYRILQPFLQIRGLLEFPFPAGDSPLDFLNDPCRAGDLYSDPRDIREDTILLWIKYAKHCLIEGHMGLWTRWLYLLENCQPSPKILHELESLDLAQLCDPTDINPATHYQLHDKEDSPLGDLHYILDWLWRFPDPPQQAIAFWEKQNTVIERCRDTCPRPKQVRDPSYDQSRESSPGVE